MADKRKNVDEATIVPLPGEEDAAEHQRIRSSNDRDQALEREGKPSRHNEGYDQAVRGDAPGAADRGRRRGRVTRRAAARDLACQSFEG